MEKIFLVTDSKNDITPIMDELIALDDNLNIARKFSTEVDEDTIYMYYKDMNEICLDYKNNSILYVSLKNDVITEGITLDEYYNKDLFHMNYQDFNSLSNFIVNDSSTLVIWLDRDTKEVLSRDIKESKVFTKVINDYNIKYLYFYNDETKVIVDTILKYVNATDNNLKAEILEEYS